MHLPYIRKLTSSHETHRQLAKSLWAHKNASSHISIVSFQSIVIECNEKMINVLLSKPWLNWLYLNTMHNFVFSYYLHLSLSQHPSPAVFSRIFPRICYRIWLKKTSPLTSTVGVYLCRYDSAIIFLSFVTQHRQRPLFFVWSCSQHAVRCCSLNQRSWVWHPQLIFKASSHA